jgi:hypothetical protein
MNPYARKPSARGVFLHLLACVALAIAVALDQVFGLGRFQRRGARRFEIDLDCERIEEQVRLLSAWFLRSRRRPRYSRREWILILEYAERFRLTVAETARAFLVSEAAVHRARRRRRQGKLGPGTAPARPAPPCPRVCDSRRLLVAQMARAGFGGDRTIARHLRLHGERLSARSVRRFRENPLGQEPRPEARRRSRRIKHAPDVYDACAAFLALPEPFARPRLARHIMSLAEALAEAIAADSLRRLDDGSLDDLEAPALRRTRLAQQLAILHARLSRVPPRHRPRYTDGERAAVLALKHRFRLSHATLAAWFLLDPGTLSDWMRDVDHPELRLRPLVQPIADLETAVAEVQSKLPPLPRRLLGTVHATLAALAARAPVRRWSTRRTRADRKTVRSRPVRRRTLSPIRALYPNHFWSADLTVITLGHTFHLLAIVDLYSRDVLAWELFARKPGSREVKALFEQAVARHGRPENFVSDQGEEFQGELKAALDDRDIDHRQGAVGQHGSIAIIERLWKSAKEHLDLMAVRPQIPAILLERVAIVIDYYRTKRPHTALGNATPHEVYWGLPSRAHEAKPMPRAWRGQPSPPAPFVIRHAFPDERTLPYLERVA